MGDFLSACRRIPLCCREFNVRSERYGIHGRIDEVRFFPKQIFVIDDKHSNAVYQSHISQIFGYCLALKDFIQPIFDTFPPTGAMNFSPWGASSSI